MEYIQRLPTFVHRQYELRQLLREIYPFFLTYPILKRFAAIRRQLRPPYGKGLIGDMDTLIAATDQERNLTILTTDQDFTRVSTLKVETINLKAA